MAQQVGSRICFLAPTLKATRIKLGALLYAFSLFKNADHNSPNGFHTHEWAVIYRPTVGWVVSLRPRVAGAHRLGTPQSVSIAPNSRTPSQLPPPHPISRSSSPTWPGAGMTQSFSHIQADISQRPGEEPEPRAEREGPSQPPCRRKSL